MVVGPVNLEAGTYQISGSIDVQTFFAAHLWQAEGLGFQGANSGGSLDLADEFEIRPPQAGIYILSVQHGLPGTDPLGAWQLSVR